MVAWAGQARAGMGEMSDVGPFGFSAEIYLVVSRTYAIVRKG